jgi:hypothetical protein
VVTGDIETGTSLGMLRGENVIHAVLVAVADALRGRETEEAFDIVEPSKTKLVAMRTQH